MDSYEDRDELLAQATERGERIVQEVSTEGLEPAWRALDDAIADYERVSGGTVEELLPPDVEGLAFSLPGIDRARELTARLLCNQRENLQPVIQASVGAGVPAVTMALMGGLDLPQEAFPIAGSWAGIIVTRGLLDLCADQSEEADGPG